ncbi:hypothetical protein [Natrinema pallidum]|uniref:Uncharacterized protein n=2 Tax=Natrinema pallidum TaxID=69527 RepID=L9Z1V7_9EURY|nr:hypothetical protein [Natrinema pallidum]ELY79896.1 hypothetical protein C487_05914 [Natrinema pallidum DSM 3751]QCW02235.1 hypothetical protein FGF80_02850 [Natrinema pallidum]
MITCTNCETAQFLQITQSRVYFEDGEMINEISETYECTLCGATGKYVYDDDSDEETVSGEVEHTTERPKYA